MDVTIRSATTQDFPAIFKLIKEFSIFQQCADKVRNTVDQMVDDKDLFHCFVAETEHKEVVGFASYFFAYYSWTGKAIYLDDLYVQENFRKQGTGKKLLSAVIQLAENERCKKLRWQVSKWNSNAIAFYKSLGAAIDETEINCDLVIPDG